MKQFTIRHSGWSGVSVGYDERLERYIWPIDEYLARTKHGANVAARIRRLNPDGKVEGERPRGWHPSGNFGYDGRRRTREHGSRCALCEGTAASMVKATAGQRGQNVVRAI